VSNAVSVQFAGGLPVLVQAFADANFDQIVIIEPPSGHPAVFRGSGEGSVPMHLDTPGFLTPSGSDESAAFMTPGDRSELVTYRITCAGSAEASQKRFSLSPASVLNLATVCTEASVTMFSAWETV